MRHWRDNWASNINAYHESLSTLVKKSYSLYKYIKSFVSKCNIPRQVVGTNGIAKTNKYAWYSSLDPLLWYHLLGTYFFGVQSF